ncbi:MED6-domain-containing protein [Dendrothele bispora CBS 962.96]|uniref:Mediator of RNA polymerase II transcription subunit 6 n=1 Tax=Dendrothele bispora (strain CBS 962.96) TaxID=1314807 RepID=A0A4S8MTQ3_DENBC|nr:MED6-domain-containing protein [Dendrothele bispora CBS 962.96]
MNSNDLHPPDDYSHRFFIWHEWIQANGLLTEENVFEYFTTSMFYDKQSNNQVLRMQTQHAVMPSASTESEESKLKKMVGQEFAVVHSQPPQFFIIQKRERLSPDEVRPLAAYFVMNNRIYQAPDVYTVLSNRLLASLHSIQSSLDILRTHRPDYTPRTGFVWPIVDPSISDDSNKRQDSITSLTTQDISAEPTTKVQATNQSGTPKRQQNNALLMNAMRATAAHSPVSLSTSALARTAESVPPEPPAGPSTTRNSVTPVPTVSRVSTPKIPTQEPAIAAKSAPGGGKKKRKRTMPTENTLPAS